MTEGKELEQVFEAELATYVKYNSNNSGGNFWLSAEDWKKLVAAGWVINRKTYFGDDPGGANRYGLTLREAIQEFEELTGQDAGAQGCNCCGPPHEFEERDIATDKYIRSMSHIVTESWDI
jgi:hypothetical protein